MSLVPSATVKVQFLNMLEMDREAYMKYSKASSLDCRMSESSRAMSVRLVGSMLYLLSEVM